ncbi:MAG: hypothetical protein JW751_01945 [Polyangiaceae bacterium]|nr:hypothetical protein [Polyangiaceae bacterium]
MLRSTRLVLLLLLAIGCLSEDGAVERWEAWLEEHDSCAADDDCALVHPGCPLDCAAAVNASEVEEAEAKAERLIDRYERSGRGCEYECAAEYGVECADGRCTVIWPVG